MFKKSRQSNALDEQDAPALESSDNKANSSKASSGQQPANMPLFFKNPQALDKERHKDAGLSRESNFSFAQATNSVPINAIEFIEAVKHYPIVFGSSDLPMPMAVVGLREQNFFVDKSGTWRERSYIPAYLRQYPFVFFQDTKQEKFYLCVDEGSKQYQAKADQGSNPLFVDGEASPMTDNALKFCTAYYTHYNITTKMCEDLKKHDLLSPYQSQVTTPSGEQINLSGFLMIDEVKFNALSNEAILELREKGWLAPIYLALASTSNWNQLANLSPADAGSPKPKPKKSSHIEEA